MNSQLLDSEFTVADVIKVNHKWVLAFPEWKGVGDGHLLVLAPPCASEPDLSNISAVATTPSGKKGPLGFDKVVVNKTGCISLYVEGIFVKIVPVGSKVKFEEVSDKAVDDESQYVAQGELDVFKADTILSRLEKEGVRFQIETLVGPKNLRNGGTVDVRRLMLYIHVDDVPAWERIISEYFPA